MIAGILVAALTFVAFSGLAYGTVDLEPREYVCVHYHFRMEFRQT